MERREEILRICSVGLRKVLSELQVDFETVQEIRLRAGMPLMIRTEEGEFLVDARTGQLNAAPENAVCIAAKEIRESLEYMGNYSLYAYEEEIRQGFLTVQGGHRVGVAGKTVIENGKIHTLKNISFLHIRIAHEKRGCGDQILPYLYNREQQRWFHSLIISPPGCGKTTLLRDLIRLISDGIVQRQGIPNVYGQHVSVVDERSELAACYKGIPQNYLGCRTDVMDGCPKTEGMKMMLRSMSPQVLAVDEIGDGKDLEAIRQATVGGCSVLATAHGGSRKDILEKWGGERKNFPVFERFVVLSRTSGAGTLEEIMDENGFSIYRREGDTACG